MYGAIPAVVAAVATGACAGRYFPPRHRSGETGRLGAAYAAHRLRAATAAAWSLSSKALASARVANLVVVYIPSSTRCGAG